MSKSCEYCEDSGIVGVANGSVPITCVCEVGKNAKEANPSWAVANIEESTK